MKNEFIKDQLWNAAWRASTQRANIYSQNKNQDNLKQFRKDIKKNVLEFIDDNIYSLSEEKLMHKIESLSKKYSRDDISFKIGHSQNLINLMLKYYWCLEWLKYTPPHCPIDRMILVAAKVKINGKIPSWTKLSSIVEYKDIIKQIKFNEDVQCLSQWELKEYQKIIKK